MQGALYCVGCGVKIPDNILRDKCRNCASDPHLVAKRKKHLPASNYINIILRDDGGVECAIANDASATIIRTRLMAYRDDSQQSTTIVIMLPKESEESL